MEDLLYLSRLKAQAFVSSKSYALNALGKTTSLRKEAKRSRSSGRLVDERLFDEEGVMLPEVVYEWADIQALAVKAEPAPAERRPA
jgi:hypothetical protein